MSFSLAVLVSLLALPLMTAFTTLGLVNAFAMTAVAASVGGGKALWTLDGKPPLWNSRSAPVFVQSFEPSSLKEMRSKGLKTRMVQLVDGDSIDLKTGKITYAMPFDRPYDWCTSGDTRLFADMVTPAGLAEIRTYADGIGVWKPYVVPVRGQVDAAGQLVDVNGDGKVDLRDAATQTPTSLVAEAHRQGLFVHVFTFRNEKRQLASSYRDDPQAEYLQFFRLGVDGVFSEFPDTAVKAREAYLRGGGR
jgi:glycerophosphoryl diester phosphodiesterase